MSLGFVAYVDWDLTDNHLADCMTKKGTSKKADWLLAVARTNMLDKIWPGYILHLYLCVARLLIYLFCSGYFKEAGGSPSTTNSEV